MSEIYSHLFEEVDLRLESETVGLGFEVPQSRSEKLRVGRLPES